MFTCQHRFKSHFYKIKELCLPCTFLGFCSRFRSGEASCLPFSALCFSFSWFLACLRHLFLFMRGGGHVVVVSFHPLFGWMPSVYTKWDMAVGMTLFFFAHMSGILAPVLNSNSDSAVTWAKRGNALVYNKKELGSHALGTLLGLNDHCQRLFLALGSAVCCFHAFPFLPFLFSVGSVDAMGASLLLCSGLASGSLLMQGETLTLWGPLQVCLSFRSFLLPMNDVGLAPHLICYVAFFCGLPL